MSKMQDKWIDLTTGTTGVNGQKLIANYASPKNYTPTAVDLETLDKISAHLKGIDLRLGQLSTGLTYVDQLETTDGSTSEYTVTNTFGNDSKIDVLLNGTLMEEGRDWERDVNANKITFIDDNSNPLNLPNNAVIRIRLYTGSNHLDQLNTGDGSTSSFTLTNPISVNSKIDVWINGIIGKENTDWERDTVTPAINILKDGSAHNLENNARLRSRIYDITYTDEFFSGGSATYAITENFENDSKIDVYFNGQLMRETNDWTRDSGNNEISIVGGASTTTSDTEIRVRIWFT